MKVALPARAFTVLVWPSKSRKRQSCMLSSRVLICLWTQESSCSRTFGLAAILPCVSSQSNHMWALLPADALGVPRAQSKRGGRVQLHTLLPPETEYGDGDKGEALYASELALSLEKLNFTVRRT